MFDSIRAVFEGPCTLESIGICCSMIIGWLFTILYLYQYFYIFVALFHKPLRYPATDQSKRYAVVIAARNEENVLPELLKSLAAQTYPKERLTVFVIADNCTDHTADVARTYGAVVYERQNKEFVGKGYALEFLFDHIKEDYGLCAHDAYIVLDADNVLRPNYVEEMDKAHCAGYNVLTSYRNSKNYGANWISAGYALWFMRESRHLNNPRSILGTSAAISGTGFLVDSSIIERNGGWKHFLLTEDIEFTVDCAIHHEKIGYCHHAELFDEQPETFRQSWQQRKRWAKGYFQVFHHYGKALCKGSLKLHWACYDITMNIMPALILTIAQLLIITGLFFANLIVTHTFSLALLKSLGISLAYGYGIFIIMGFFTLVTEWKKIHCNKFKTILLFFTFPVFMLTYIPIAIVAFFSHVEWKPIQHKRVLTVNEIEGQSASPDDTEKPSSEKQE